MGDRTKKAKRISISVTTEVPGPIVAPVRAGQAVGKGRHFNRRAKLLKEVFSSFLQSDVPERDLSFVVR